MRRKRSSPLDWLWHEARGAHTGGLDGELIAGSPFSLAEFAPFVEQGLVRHAIYSGSRHHFFVTVAGAARLRGQKLCLFGGDYV